MKALRVDVLRGESVESSHEVFAIVTDGEGKVLEKWGTEDDFETAWFPRSAIKPLQALLMVESGALAKYSLSAQHVALAAASHSGEKQHVELVSEWLSKLGLSEGDLECGAHWPYEHYSMLESIRQHEKPSALTNNCSGKHSGFLSACRAHDWPIKNYTSRDHILQKTMRARLSEVFAYDLEKAPWGIDGCSIPTIAVPPANLARGMCFLGRKQSASETISSAMWEFPELVGGSNDFISRQLRLGASKFVVKNGAEGICAGYNFRDNVGFVIKCRDGHARARDEAVAFLLSQWKLTLPSEPTTLTNWNGLRVGRLEVRVEKK